MVRFRPWPPIPLKPLIVQSAPSRFLRGSSGCSTKVPHRAIMAGNFLQRSRHGTTYFYRRLSKKGCGSMSSDGGANSLSGEMTVDSKTRRAAIRSNAVTFAASMWSARTWRAHSCHWRPLPAATVSIAVHEAPYTSGPGRNNAGRLQSIFVILNCT